MLTLKYKFHNWKWNLENRIHCFRYGHPKYAKWDICGWFTDNIITLLDSFINNPYCSVPMVYHPETDVYVADEEWIPRLKLMRYGFARYKAVHEDMVGYEELAKQYGVEDEIGRIGGRNSDEFREFMKAWWKEEEKAVMALNRSLKMFAEHFGDLWD